jgi:hypothetical protein
VCILHLTARRVWAIQFVHSLECTRGAQDLAAKLVHTMIACEGFVPAEEQGRSWISVRTGGSRDFFFRIAVAVLPVIYY